MYHTVYKYRYMTNTLFKPFICWLSVTVLGCHNCTDFVINSWVLLWMHLCINFQLTCHTPLELWIDVYDASPLKLCIDVL